METENLEQEILSCYGCGYSVKDIEGSHPGATSVGLIFCTLYSKLFYEEVAEDCHDKRRLFGGQQ